MDIWVRQMSYNEVFAEQTIGISISESPDLAYLGMTGSHLNDAMSEFARYFLALGAKLAYAGDLRRNGFSIHLFELVTRHRRDVEGKYAGVVNYLGWPNHIAMSARALHEVQRALTDSAQLVCLSLAGDPLPHGALAAREVHEPDQMEWAKGLSNMRRFLAGVVTAQIVLGGRVADYKGVMPGVAEEALCTIGKQRPLFIVGGFGGCARDIAEAIGIAPRWAGSRTGEGFGRFRNISYERLNNGLTGEENMILATTPHVDRAIALVLKGLQRTKLRAPG
jgi:hypothetical protein